MLPTIVDRADVAVLIQGINGLSGLPILFGDVAKVPGFAPGGLTIITWIVLHPLLGFAAFGRRLRTGIMALASMALMEWVSDIPSLITHGLKLSGDDAFVVSLMVFKSIIQPTIAGTALAAAWLDRYLAAATIAVMLPTLVDVASVAAFAVSVILYGF
jgi:hypothetical protein